MRIGSVAVRSRENWAELTAQITLSSGNSVVGVIAVEEAFSNWLSPSVEPFLIAMLTSAMAGGEDIETDFPMSDRCVYNLHRAQQYFVAAYPGQYKQAEIRAPQSGQFPRVEGRHVAVTFSGGVDSLYSLRESLALCPVESMRATHALFIQGFDLSAEEADTYECCRKQYQAQLADLGVTLVSIRTNLKQHFTVPWRHVFGSLLASVGAALGNGIRNLYVPSNGYGLSGIPDGSDARLDHWLSSGQVEVMHHASAIQRIEKVRALADWEFAQRNLRVCWEHPNGLRNCGRCSKCVRTMLELDLVGALGRFPVFDAPLPTVIRQSTCFTPAEKEFVEELSSLIDQNADAALRRRIRMIQAGHKLRWSLGRVKRLFHLG